MHRRDLLKAVLGAVGVTALLPHVPATALPPVPALPPAPAYPWAVTAADHWSVSTWPTWYIEGLDVNGNSLGLVEMPLVDNVTGDISPLLSHYYDSERG